MCCWPGSPMSQMTPCRCSPAINCPPTATPCCTPTGNGINRHARGAEAPIPNRSDGHLLVIHQSSIDGSNCCQLSVIVTVTEPRHRQLKIDVTLVCDTPRLSSGAWAGAWWQGAPGLSE